jgi:hypothetical protein
MSFSKNLHAAMKLRFLPYLSAVFAYALGFAPEVVLTSRSALAQPSLPQAALPQAALPETATDAEYIKRSAIDGSIAIELPPNWFYTAQGGHVVATAPQGRSGVLFKVFAVNARSDGQEPQPNVINSAYRPPPAFIHDVLSQYHNRSVQVLGWRVDEAAAKRCRLAIKRECDAADVVARWVSVEGSHCVGALKLVNASPTAAGQWFSVVAGLWGSAPGLNLDTPALERAVSSLTTADKSARTYLDDSMAQIRLLGAHPLFASRKSGSER